MAYPSFLRKSRRMRAARSLISGINITPMVDVMLVLLVIFMVTAPFLSAGIDVRLPDAAGKALDTSNTPIVITLDSAGMIYYQRDIVSQGQLKTRVSRAVAANPQVRFFVRADTGISYGHLMAVVGLISASGVQHIAFVTDPSSGIKSAKGR